MLWLNRGGKICAADRISLARIAGASEMQDDWPSRSLNVRADSRRAAQRERARRPLAAAARTGAGPDGAAAARDGERDRRPGREGCRARAADGHVDAGRTRCDALSAPAARAYAQGSRFTWRLTRRRRRRVG